MPLVFEWDPDKALQNHAKHGVGFSEGATVFGDRLAVTTMDPRDFGGEVRLITMGLSHRQRLLAVAHVEREERIRIISARMATPKERRQYERER